METLKRRKVVQWALAYVAGAWVALQVLQLLSGAFGWPNGTLRIATVVLALGFFVTMTVVWYHGERGEQRVSSIELSILTLLLLLGGGVLWLIEGRETSSKPTAMVAESAPAAAATKARADSRSRLAVLPFDNMSPDPANAFFADGLHEELLSTLTRLGELDLISRTTMQTYRGSGKAVGAIATELGASHVLEGSVRRDGERVRLTMQLIDAGSDGHVWAETYDRTLSDALGLQAEVAGQIADALKLRLGTEARRALATAPSRNVQAYDRYLQAKVLDRSFDLSAKGRATQERLLDEVLALEPGFVAALTLRARLHLWMLWSGIDVSAARLAKARADIDRAKSLAPDSIDVARSEAEYVYRGLADYPRALTMLRAIEQRAPTDPQVQETIAWLLRRLGDFAGCDRILERLTALDPQNVSLWSTYLNDLHGLRRYQDGLALIERLERRFPGNLVIDGWRIDFEFSASNDLAGFLRDCVAHALKLPPDLAQQSRVTCSYHGGQVAEMHRALEAYQGDTLPWGAGLRYPVALSRAGVYWLEGRKDAARSTALSLNDWFLDEVAAQTRDRHPYFLHQLRAEMHALAGEPSAAQAEIERAMALLPVEKEAFLGTRLQRTAAEVMAIIGERDRALDLIEQSLAVPYGYHASNLLADPILAKALAGNPRWEALRQRLQAGFER